MRTSPATIRRNSEINSRRRAGWAKGTRGLTMMELLIACLVLALVAAVAIPSVEAEQKSREAKANESNLVDFPLQAEAEAAKLKMPVDIRVEGTQLVMEQEPLDGSAATQIKTLDLGDYQATAASLNGQDTSPGAWQWQAYPDGTTDTGGLGFSLNSQDWAMTISPTGEVTWKQETLPPGTDDTWQAGQLALRTTD